MNNQKKQYADVVVLGAGIQGAGVAQAAAAQGYKTLILEKFPEAGMGTSCKSSKLIHGGLRYLESGQFKLVNECLNERKLLLDNAPELVKLIPFYIPVYKNSLRPAWLIYIGLLIYSFFSLKSFSIVEKKNWHSLDGINLKNLKMVFKYYDAQTDDKKLTQAVIHSALKLNANIEYNAEFLSSDIKHNKHRITYQKNQQLFTVRCKCIVNCTGPWVARTQKNIYPELKLPDIELVAGTHIIINRAINRGIYYLEATDKRAVFVMPWKNKTTLIGTTEKNYTGDPGNIFPTEEEKNYLLNTYNRYFNFQATQENIIDAFAGLRVLPVSPQSAFNKSRESLIIHNTNSTHKSPGLITLIGGKLTAYRASAEEVLGLINKQLGKGATQDVSRTKNIKLLLSQK